MNNKDATVGIVMTLSITVIAFFLYLFFFKNSDTKTAIATLYNQKYLSETITKCTFLNFITLFLMIFYKRDGIAQFIFGTMILINIFTLFL